MRVLQVHTRYRQAGGEDSVVEAERNVLQNAGHDVVLHELQNPHDSRAALKALAKAPWNSDAAADVVESARKHEADVVHVHNTWFSLSPSVFPALKRSGFPVVLTLHNYRLACVNSLLYRDGRPCEDCVGRMPWRGIAHRCYRGSALQSAVVAVTIGTHRLRGTWGEDVDVFVALTRHAARILTHAGVPEDRVAVKPNFVDDPGSRSSPPSQSGSVLFVGRLSEEKGVMDLIEAWGDGPAPGLELVVIGDGPLLDEVRLAAGEHCDVVGRLSANELRRRMLESRAVVVPSRWYEGMPMVLLEAMAAGLPVVVSDHPPLEEAAGRGGMPYQALSVSSLRQSLERLGEDDLVDRVGGWARAEYSDRFDPEGGVRRLLEVYERAKSG